MNYLIPKSVEELSSEQFEKLIKVYNKNYDSKVDMLVDFISIMLNITIDEVEDMNIEDIMLIRDEINIEKLFDMGELIMVNQVEVDGITYKSRAIDGKYDFKLKEMRLLETYIRNNDSFIDYMMAIVFKNVDENGEIIDDNSEESINNRNKTLKGLNIKISAPYLILLSKKLEGRKIFIKGEDI